MSDNWIVGNLQSAFNTWNDKLAEIWTLLTTTPQDFRGGGIWTAITNINNGMVAIGYGLLVLFFAMGMFQSAASFKDFQRPEFALRHLIRFIAAKVAVGSAMEVMTTIFSICGGIVQSVMSSVGGMASASVTIPQEMVDTIESVGFLESIPLWLVTLLGSLFITVLSFILIMTVYGRFFRLYFYTALPRCLWPPLRERIPALREKRLSSPISACAWRAWSSPWPAWCSRPLCPVPGRCWDHVTLRRHNVLAVCGRDHLQYACPGGPRQRS